MSMIRKPSSRVGNAMAEIVEAQIRDLDFVPRVQIPAIFIDVCLKG